MTSAFVEVRGNASQSPEKFVAWKIFWKEEIPSGKKKLYSFVEESNMISKNSKGSWGIKKKWYCNFEIVFEEDTRYFIVILNFVYMKIFD